LVLARAGGRLREDQTVLRFLKEVVDDASSDRRMAFFAIYLLLFAPVDQSPVESVSEAP
jgi:hypothetical protein